MPHLLAELSQSCAEQAGQFTTCVRSCHRPRLTNVVGVELVHADEDTSRREPDKPHYNVTQDWEFARVQVIGQDAVETLYETSCSAPVTAAESPRRLVYTDDVSVSYESNGEDAIDDRVD